jgi:lipopolysaccharide transport system ATP-binding protein
MSDTIVQADNVGKRYHLGPQEPLLRQLMRPLRAWYHRRKYSAAGPPTPTTPNEEFWALRDVSFNIERGHVVGIIGRNGSGKSTLLKILSRITEPTTGRIELTGRVASLLEVGTGFHPDLTGRENIYMNGSLLGMRRKEINEKLDEIVTFADVDRFLDTPIKRYSSGMYTRLAFAVAAHLESEILILDEVLAVGDAGFQRKCLGKMNEASRQGRTVFFVSHNLPSILALCDRCMMLDKGVLVKEGPTTELTAFYQRSFYQKPTNPSDLRDAQHYGNGKARFTEAFIYSLNEAGERQSYLATGGDLYVDLKVEAHQTLTDADAQMIIYSTAGDRLIDANLSMQGESISLHPGEIACVRFHLHGVLLKPGSYDVGLWLGRTNVEDVDGIACVNSITVEPEPTQEHRVSFPGFYQCRFSKEVAIFPNAQNSSVSWGPSGNEFPPMGTRQEKKHSIPTVSVDESGEAA